VQEYGTINIKMKATDTTTTGDRVITNKGMALQSGSSLSVTTTGTPGATAPAFSIIGGGLTAPVTGDFSNFNWNGGYNWHHGVSGDDYYRLSR
jgi:hypothetical protein